MWKKDIYAVIFVFAVCLLAYWETLPYPYQSAYFPRIIIGLLALTTCALLGKSILAGRKEKQEVLQETQEYGEKIPIWKQQAVRKVVLMIVASAIYLVVLSFVGFFVTTLVYLPVMIRLLGVRKLVTIALSTSVVVFFIYLVFRAFLNVPLPEGLVF